MFNFTRAFVLCVFVGVVLGLGGFTFRYAQGWSYFSNDPTACVNCHVMREHYDGWQKASHHAHARCNDCHMPHAFIAKYLVKADNGFWHSKGFTLQDFPEPIRIRPRNLKVLNDACIHCHRDLVSEVAQHGGENLNCVHCHSSVGHGPQM